MVEISLEYHGNPAIFSSFEVKRDKFHGDQCLEKASKLTLYNQNKS
jgi:hypothetical protein